jgi:hypothetical protein
MGGGGKTRHSNGKQRIHGRGERGGGETPTSANAPGGALQRLRALELERATRKQTNDTAIEHARKVARGGPQEGHGGSTHRGAVGHTPAPIIPPCHTHRTRSWASPLFLNRARARSCGAASRATTRAMLGSSEALESRSRNRRSLCSRAAPAHKRGGWVERWMCLRWGCGKVTGPTLVHTACLAVQAEQLPSPSPPPPHTHPPTLDD